VLVAVTSALAISCRAITRAVAVAAAEPHGLLREGNALLNVGFTAGAAAGPALAGVIVAGAGAQTALFVDAVSFAVVAMVLATASDMPRTRPEVAGWTTRLRRAFSYVANHPQLRLLIVAQALAFVFFTVVIPIEVVFAKETLGAGDAGYGVLLASWGAGMVVGSIAFALLRRVSLRFLLPIATFAVGLAYLLTGIAPSLAFACGASVLGGAGNGIEWVALVTAVQQLTRAEYQTRVASLVESVARAAPGVGFLLGGATAALFNPRVSFAVAGFGVIVVLAFACVALWRAGWRGEPAADLGFEETLQETTGVPQISDNIGVGNLETQESTSR
jgi:predicted MFS family arabinose efflux permease